MNLRADLFKPEPKDASRPDIAYPSLHQKVGLYLAKLVAKEVEHGGNPELTKWAARNAAQFRELFQQEFRAFSRLQYPYDTIINEDKSQAVRNWWGSLIGREGAEILPVCLCFIFKMMLSSY